MSKVIAKPGQAKAPTQPSKAPEKKAFKAEDFASLTIPVEEVRDIKTAFDIFDGDLSGVVDPQELKRAFEQLGFGGQNKFVRSLPSWTMINQEESTSLNFCASQLPSSVTKIAVPRSIKFGPLSMSTKL